VIGYQEARKKEKMRVGRKILRAKMADYGEERKKDGNTEFTEIGTQRAQR